MTAAKAMIALGLEEGFAVNIIGFNSPGNPLFIDVNLY
jgi:hypothetical protein